MDQHEIDAELADASELIDSTQACHLGYTAKDGTARVIAAGFFWTGSEFVVSTASISPKVAAITERPQVSLAIDAGGTPGEARTLSVRGRASITVVDGVTDEYIAAAYRSYDEDAAREFEKNVRNMYDRQARIAIMPTWVRYWDFGSGRIPRFLAELAEKAGS